MDETGLSVNHEYRWFSVHRSQLGISSLEFDFRSLVNLKHGYIGLCNKPILYERVLIVPLATSGEVFPCTSVT